MPADRSTYLDLARQVAEAARTRAEAIGVAENIAVVDVGNNLVTFERMDGAWLGSIDIALGKAYTARAFEIPTAALGEQARPGGPLFGIHETNGGRIVIFGGGIPLTRDHVVVGAIGVSGGSVEQDVTVAEAGVRAFEAWWSTAAAPAGAHAGGR